MPPTPLALPLLLIAAPPAAERAAPPVAPVLRTEIVDPAAFVRLRANSGLTLQWIGWERRGELRTRMRGPVLELHGGQQGAQGDRLELDGDVVRVERDRFVLRGRVLIADAPDAGRRCERTGDLEFQATGTRRYWRMQRMEECDGLTDYVDVYF